MNHNINYKYTYTLIVYMTKKVKHSQEVEGMLNKTLEEYNTKVNSLDELIKLDNQTIIFQKDDTELTDIKIIISGEHIVFKNRDKFSDDIYFIVQYNT